MATNDYTQSHLSEEGYFSKEYTRLRVLEIVSQSCLLWDEDEKHLTCSWMELAGADAPTLRMLLERGVLGPDSLFYGVDKSVKVLEGCRRTYADVPQARWLSSDMPTIVGNHPDVGVLVFDSHNGVAGRSFKRALGKLSTFAKDQSEKLGEFLLVINTTPQHRSQAEVEAYPSLLKSYFDIPVREQDIHKYISKKTSMYWIALRWGF